MHEWDVTSGRTTGDADALAAEPADGHPGSVTLYDEDGVHRMAVAAAYRTTRTVGM